MSMDPDEAVTQMRLLSASLIKAADEDPDEAWTEEQLQTLANEAIQLAETVQGLDGWMTAGGFLPEQWKHHLPLGRPRQLTEGVVLDGVAHGTRGSYNRGCRCLECRAANAAGGADYRAKKRGKADGHV